MDIFSEQEKVELERLNEQPVLLCALKKIFLADIYQNGTLEPNKDPDFLRNYAFSLSFDPSTGQEYARSNEDLGKALRACNEALRMISISFQKISKYKKVINIDLPNKNKAR